MNRTFWFGTTPSPLSGQPSVAHLREGADDNRIPYRISGGTSFSPVPDQGTSWPTLKLLVNPDEDTAFLRVVNLPRREIGPTTLENWANAPTSAARACLPRASSWGWSNTSPGVASVRCRPLPTGWCGSAIQALRQSRWRRYET